MLRKTTIMFCAALAYTNVFAVEDQMANDEIKAQIDALKQQIAEIKDNLDANQSNNTFANYAAFCTS